jgi:hypothetical protein
MQYPKHRREGKDKAAEAYPRAVERIIANHPGLDYDQARAYLRQKTIEYAASPAGNNGVFTPLPASWLNAGRFEDEAESWTKGTSTNGTNLHDPRGTLATAENYLRMRTEAQDATGS